MTNSTVSADALGVLSAYYLRAAFADDLKSYGDPQDIFEVADTGLGKHPFTGESPELAFGRGTKYGIALAAAIMSEPLGTATEDAIRRLTDNLRAKLASDAPHRDSDRVAFDKSILGPAAS